jgi:hypothetical protein
MPWRPALSAINASSSSAIPRSRNPTGGWPGLHRRHSAEPLHRLKYRTERPALNHRTSRTRPLFRTASDKPLIRLGHRSILLVFVKRKIQSPLDRLDLSPGLKELLGAFDFSGAQLKVFGRAISCCGQTIIPLHCCLITISWMYTFCDSMYMEGVLRFPSPCPASGTLKPQVPRTSCAIHEPRIQDRSRRVPASY